MDFISLVAKEDNVEAKNVLTDMLSQKVTAALDGRKTEIASRLFNGGIEQETTTDEVSVEQ